ncbi:MAG TPA: hypothetical protein VGG45_02405 [Terracidiphilus sp.]|jgi:hypothetical protein
MSDRGEVIAVWRSWLFGTGVVLCCLSAIGVVLCFIVPFPLIHLSNGGLMVNPWDQRVLCAAVLASLLASLLAAFGRGVQRILLIVLAAILALLAIVGYVQNHV